jgi:hypothetical protein
MHRFHAILQSHPATKRETERKTMNDQGPGNWDEVMISGDKNPAWDIIRPVQEPSQPRQAGPA